VFWKNPNGMTYNPNTTLKLIYWFIYRQSSVPFKQLSSMKDNKIYISLCTHIPEQILLAAIVKYNTIIYNNNVTILNQLQTNLID
jgi:hypothetical protein